MCIEIIRAANRYRDPIRRCENDHDFRASSPDFDINSTSIRSSIRKRSQFSSLFPARLRYKFDTASTSIDSCAVSSKLHGDSVRFNGSIEMRGERGSKGAVRAVGTNLRLKIDPLVRYCAVTRKDPGGGHGVVPCHSASLGTRALGNDAAVGGSTSNSSSSCSGVEVTVAVSMTAATAVVVVAANVGAWTRRRYDGSARLCVSRE